MMIMMLIIIMIIIIKIINILLLLLLLLLLLILIIILIIIIIIIILIIILRHLRPFISAPMRENQRPDSRVFSSIGTPCYTKYFGPKTDRQPSWIPAVI